MPDDDVVTQMERGKALVLAVMASASTERIDPRRWWERAKTALETGAAVSADFPEMVSVMARKLEIEVLSTASAERVNALAHELGEDFEPFRRLCEDQALYAVAMAQAARAEEREDRQRELSALLQDDEGSTT